ncbi:tRNA dihydrouridine synthase DusB [Synechococcus elongatus IITB4]|uniref:tRNA dihydrouridine synthase DusB n=1 Tax=Synechococcus elongatus TaxID=32046 RepID=UPI0030CCA306
MAEFAVADRAIPAYLQTPLQVGSLTLHSRVLQSPLAGVSDRSFRQLVRRSAPQSLIFAEMAHAGLQLEGRDRWQFLPSEQPIGAQLFGYQPEVLAAAAQQAEAAGAVCIDLNMGCPVNKVTRKRGGSALLQEPELAIAIVQAIAAAVRMPVTVKTRLGWEQVTILDFARQLEDAGAQLLTLHARSRSQGYSGQADWRWIARVKSLLSIPVIANGDINSPADAIACLQQTSADGVMCGRGSLGNPGLVGAIDCYLQTGALTPELTLRDRLQFAREHLLLLWEDKGVAGLLQARKHLGWYLADQPDHQDLRQQLLRSEDLSQSLDLLDAAIATENLLA